MKNRVISIFIAVQLVLCSLTGAVSVVYASGSEITISSTDDFLKLAKKCTLDSFSDGKTVTLTCDIDFSDGEFTPIPTFGGSFIGNGHTISGVSFEKSGSYQGVFRYIRQGGSVSDLTVKGKLTPSGSKSFVGGIVGENSGTVEACTFSGTVKGENVVGGIAGNNTDYGKIIGCSSSGSVTGENSTGGIAGKNSGFIQNCTANAAVNTVYEEKKSSVSDVDADTGAIIENLKNKENEEESVLGHSDTGGIAGYSSGIIQGCTNNGAVGYTHIGYNVGGIVGRQSGFVLGSENHGFIQGRKDVGGIVGQAEPYVLLNPSEKGLKNLRNELNRLSGMVNKLITDADNLGDDIEKHFDEISKYADTASNNAEAMTNRGTDFIDDNLDEINAQAAIISNTLDKLVPVFTSLEDGCDDLSDSVDKIADALKEIEIYAPDLDKDIDGIVSSLTAISRSARNLRIAVTRLGKAKKNLSDAIKTSDDEAVANAAGELAEAVKAIENANSSIKSSVEKIEKVLSSKPESFEALGIGAKEIAAELAKASDNIGSITASINKISSSLSALASSTQIDFEKLKLAANDIDSAVGYTGDAALYLANGLSSLSRSINSASEKLTGYTDDITENLNSAKESLTDGIDLLSYAIDDIKTSIGDMRDIISDLSNEETAEFVKLGDDFRDESESFFSSLSGISDELKKLRDDASSHNISGDISSVNNQFNLVMNLLIDEVEDLNSGVRSLDDIFIDVSDEEIESAKQGKIEDCQNFGEVSADRNTGGIAGTMAIEYTKDPEDDIEKPDALNFTYRSRAILQGCVNDGKIVGKKDCTGGIVGSAEVGTVYRCENYGSAESTNGSYVGGIAGKSASAIRKSYAKGHFSGKRYIGGIAGSSGTVTGCCAIASIDGDENLGSICGGFDDKSNIYGNFFVDGGLGGIDGISYRNRAEPIEFEKLASIGGIPKRFISFTVSFVADGKTVETQSVAYGDPLKKIKYPPVPEKSGHFGNWVAPDGENVTEDIEIICEYEANITLLPSEEKNANGKLALALCEGEFTDKAVLHISSSEQSPPVKTGSTVVYDISLSNTDISESDSVTVRILNENKARTSAWVLKNGSWEKTKSTSRGKYTVIKMTGNKGTVCIKYEEKTTSALLVVILSLAAFGAIFAVLRLKKKKKR